VLARAAVAMAHKRCYALTMIKNCDFKSCGRKFGKLVLVLLVLGGVAWGTCYGMSWRAMGKAEAQIQKGLDAVAIDTFKPYRNWLAKRERGCRVLLSSYFQAKDVEGLKWSSQACIEAGIDIPETYFGLSSAAEFMGRDEDALRVLSAGLQKYKEGPVAANFYQGIGGILARNKRDQEAALALKKAAEMDPKNNQLAVNAIDALGKQNKWQEARPLAESLRALQTDNPTVKLLLARVYSKTGDPSGATSLVASVKEMIKTKPELEVTLKKEYADLLK
jgi:tetratricopeptide (TPR) repeat protein